MDTGRDRGFRSKPETALGKKHRSYGWPPKARRTRATHVDGEGGTDCGPGFDTRRLHMDKKEKMSVLVIYLNRGPKLRG